MKIIINDRFLLETEETNYSLYEKTIIQKGDNKGKIRVVAIAYNIPIETAIKKAIHVLIHEKEIVVSLKDFLKIYIEEKNKMEQAFKEALG